jgi:hypothetical protein
MTNPPNQPWGQPPAGGQPPWSGQPPQGQPPQGQPPQYQPQPQYGAQPPGGFGQPQPQGPQPGQPPYGTQPYGTQPYGAQPYPYGQPPAKKRGRKIALIVGGAVAAAVVALLVLGFVVGSGNPRDTADEFMAALKSKDVDKAHSLLCKDGKEKETKDELRKDFNLDDRTITNYSLGTERERKREGKDETLIPVTIDYDQGEQVKIDLGVWNEGGQKVCSLNPAGES